MVNKQKQLIQCLIKSFSKMFVLLKITVTNTFLRINMFKSLFKNRNNCIDNLDFYLLNITKIEGYYIIQFKDHISNAQVRIYFYYFSNNLRSRIWVGNLYNFYLKLKKCCYLSSYFYCQGKNRSYRIIPLLLFYRAYLYLLHLIRPMRSACSNATFSFCRHRVQLSSCIYMAVGIYAYPFQLFYFVRTYYKINYLNNIIILYYLNMGNSQDRKEQLRQYQPHLVNYTLHHTHSPLSIYRHRCSSQQIMEHREVIYHFQDVDRKLQTFYSRYQHLFIVSTQYLKLQASNGCTDGTYQIGTYYQRVITNFSRINDIPFTDSLYCYSVALKGFQILFKNYGYFQVFESMFHICLQGKLKLWCNQHIYKSVPEQYLLGNGREEDMVMKVIRIIDQNTDQSENHLNIKQILKRVRPLTFENVRSKFMQICNQNQFCIGQCIKSLQKTARIQSILDIYTQYPANNINYIRPFDTEVTFNPKKTQKNNIPTSNSGDSLPIRPNLRSSSLGNQANNNETEIYNEFNRKNKRIQILNIAQQNEKKQEGFSSFSNNNHKTGSKSSYSQQNLKKSAANYQKLMSPSKYEKQQEASHHIELYTNSPLSRLKKTTSKKSGRISDRLLFESNVNQISNVIKPQQDSITLSRISLHIRDNKQFHQSQIRQSAPKRIQQPQQNKIIRPYSLNNRVQEPQSLRISQIKLIRSNTPPQNIRQNLQQITPQSVNPRLQRPFTAQQQIILTQKNNPIYPFQKVVIKTTDQSNRLRKATRIQPTITFNKQKSLNIFFNQSKTTIDKIQQEKLNKRLVQNKSNQAINLKHPERIEKTQNNIRNNKIDTSKISQNTLINNSFNNNSHVPCISQRRRKHHINGLQTNMNRHLNIKFQPINRRDESQSSKIYQIQQRKQLQAENLLARTTEIKGFLYQKILSQDNKAKNKDNSFLNPQVLQSQRFEPTEVKKEQNIQLLQIQSKIDMLSSFAENKITTNEFFPNQQHAISTIARQKIQNSGRDSISSAFRKDLFPQNNINRNFQKKLYSNEQRKIQEKNKQYNNSKGDHDYLKTDPKVLELIKSATLNYKKQSIQIIGSKKKQATITQSFGQTDPIKQFYNYQIRDNKSRFFQILPQNKQSTNKTSQSTGIKAQQINHSYKCAEKAEATVLKKKTEPSIILKEKILAISQNWDEENICSTTNASVGKYFVENVDADILQDMYAYNMEGAKGRFK